MPDPNAGRAEPVQPVDDTQATPLPEQRWQTPVSGPAYRGSARWFVGSTVIGIAGYGLQLAVRRPEVAWPIVALLLGAGAIVLVTGWYVLTGRTTIDRHGIRQDWLPEKRYAWHEIVRARHLRMPFTSRLMISTGRGPFKAIHAGCPALDDAFREIAAYYGQRR